jgi:hypothetical protein
MSSAEKVWFEDIFSSLYLRIERFIPSNGIKTRVGTIILIGFSKSEARWKFLKRQETLFSLVGGGFGNFPSNLRAVWNLPLNIPVNFMSGCGFSNGYGR